MKNTQVKLVTKRFVIRKSLIGKNTVITFTNKNNEKCTYNHDIVYNQLKEKFDEKEFFPVTDWSDFNKMGNDEHDGY